MSAQVAQPLGKAGQENNGNRVLASMLAHPLLPRYLGRNAEQYIRFWSAPLQNRKPGLDLGFVLLMSLFCWPVWFGYRKMYKELVLLLCSAAFLGILMENLIPTSSLLISPLIALCGKTFYQWRVMGFFQEYGQLPERELLYRIKRCGGTSPKSALVVLTCWLFLNLALFASLFL